MLSFIGIVQVITIGPGKKDNTFVLTCIDAKDATVIGQPASNFDVYKLYTRCRNNMETQHMNSIKEGDIIHITGGKIVTVQNQGKTGTFWNPLLYISPESVKIIYNTSILIDRNMLGI